MSSNIKTAPLSTEIADRLLDLLSTDDAYRARFQHAPRAALYEIGYMSPEPAKMTACGALFAPVPEALIDCKVNDLASKESILAARNEIRAMLTEGLAQTSPRLDASLTDQRFVRK